MVRRVVQPPKLSTIESSIGDHSELASLYPEPKPINSNPISTPAQIAERHLVAQDKQMLTIRKSAIRISLYVITPYLLGFFTIGQIIMRIPNIAPNDIGGAMTIVFMSFLFSTATAFVAYSLLLRVKTLFNDYTLKSWQIIIVGTASMIGVTPLAFGAAQIITVDWISYFASLALIAAVGLAAIASLVYILTTRLSPRTKLGILSAYIVVSVVLLFL